MSEEIKQVEEIAEGEPEQNTTQEEHAEEAAVQQEKASEDTNTAAETKCQAEPEQHFYRRGNPFKRKAYFGDEEEELSRDEWILSRLPDKDLMEYLALEHKKAEMLQMARETRERRIFFLVQMIISLTAIVAVVYCLQSEPVVLVNILYITGIVIVLWLFKNSKDKPGSKQQ